MFLGLKCESGCKVLGKTLRELSKEFENYLANILFVFRKTIKQFTKSTLTRQAQKNTETNMKLEKF